MHPSFLHRALTGGWILIALLVAASAAGPAPVQAAPLAHDPTFSATLMSPPPRTLCPGDQAGITVFIQDTAHNLPAAGYPVNILQANPPVGETDPVSKVITNGTVHFTYKARDNGVNKGPQTDKLTFTIGGYPTGLSVPIKIADCSDYKFDFLLEKRDSNEVGNIYTYFSGKSTASRISGQLTGTETGTDEAFVSIYGGANGVTCALQPPIQGSGVFNTDGVVHPQGPGVDNLTIHFTFETISLNSGQLSCTVVGVTASYPFEASSWDPDELGLQGLSVPMQNNLGTIPISAEGLSGTLTVRREVKE